MLTTERIEKILAALPRLTIGVLGDLFLDRYLDIDAKLTEPSIETNLDAYQVTRVRSVPGAVGTVMNNLAALGVGRIVPVSVIGDDGEGYELRQALAKMPMIDARWITSSPERRTPTYTKPMLHQAGQPARELNRLDIKNRTPLPGPLQDLVMEGLHAVWPQVDALIVLDQVSEEDCGVVTARVRDDLGEHSAANSEKFVLADSRENIGAFRFVSVKPNHRECIAAYSPNITFLGTRDPKIDGTAYWMSARTHRPVFCTAGSDGIFVAHPDKETTGVWVDAYRVNGPIDIVGAGDSTSAGITSAVAAGASYEEAAAFGNLVASITIQQLGTTGSASPAQVRQRWREVGGG